MESIRTRSGRNLRTVIADTTDILDYAYSKGIMTYYAVPTEGRSVRGNGGREIVDFARGSYLGLDMHPKIVGAAIDALRSYGSLQWSGARTRLNFALMHDLEASLSALTQSRALVFSLVLTANMAVLPILAAGAFTDDVKPVVVFDQFSHATLAFHKAIVSEETEVLTIPHNDMQALEDICRRHACVAYIADGVYSMGGSAPVADLLRLQERYGLFLYIDDAHGVSIQGDLGQGYARSRISDLGRRTIVSASLSKGFGSTGGVVMLGTEQQEALLRRYAIPHTFSMGPDLAGIAGALASAELHRTSELAERQTRLRAVIKRFDDSMGIEDVEDFLPIRMVLIGDDRRSVDVAAELLERGYYLAAAFFPTVPKGKAALRVCLTADHSPAEIDGLCAAIADLTGAAARRRPALTASGGSM